MRYQFAGFLLDTEQMTLLLEGAPTPLPSTAIRLLAVLTRAYPEVVPHESIQMQVWGDTPGSQASVANLVAATCDYFTAQQLPYAVIQPVADEGYRLTESCWSSCAILPPTAAAPTRPATPASARSGPWAWSLTALGIMLALLSYIALTTENTLVRNEPANTLARILWVDDHPENNRAEQAWLNSRRVAVYQVATSEDASLLLDLYAFDLIITDMGRQQDPLAGLRLLEQVRKAGRQTPLLFYTLQASTALAAEVAERGGQGVADTQEALYDLVQSQLMGLNLIPASGL